MVSLLGFLCRTSSCKSIQRARHTLSPDGPASPDNGSKILALLPRAIHLFTAEYRDENGTRRISNGTKRRDSLTQSRGTSGTYWRRPGIVHRFIRIRPRGLIHVRDFFLNFTPLSLFFALPRFTVPLTAGRQARAKTTVDHEEGFPHKVLDLAQALLLCLFDRCCPRTSFISISIGFMGQRHPKLRFSLTYFLLPRYSCFVNNFASSPINNLTICFGFSSLSISTLTEACKALKKIPYH